MVRPPKNIQWWWSPQKPLKNCNGLFSCQWKNLQCGQASVWWPEKEPGCGNCKWFGHCTWLPHEEKKSSRVSSLPTVSCSTVFDWSALLQDNCAKHNEKWSWMRYFDWYCILLKTGSILLKSDFLFRLTQFVTIALNILVGTHFLSCIVWFSHCEMM